MGGLGTLLLAAFGLYALATGIFLITENRRPQATLAWLLAFVFAPVVGVVLYVLFGRNGKAFSRESKLLMQDLEPYAHPLLEGLLARQDGEIRQLEAQSPSHRRLMRLVRHNSRSVLATRNRVEIKQNADEFYPSMIADMESARHSIHLQYFIWRSDEFTERLKKILARKVADGVEVRLLYDPVGSQTMKRRYLKELRGAGIWAAPTSPRFRPHTISYRNHRKITVIDGAIGYTGGMNIGQEHLDGAEGFDCWRDTQVRIVGEGAAILQAVFMVDWYNAVKENLFSPVYFPRHAAEPPVAHDKVPVQILTSGPDSRWAAIRQLYANMIVTAQQHVYLQSPYFILDASIAEALRSAALSGVAVKVMLTARESGNPLPTWAGNTFILDVIDAGVRVFLYHKGYLHAKTISIDSQICSIGSANIDIRSFSINYELNAVVYSAPLAERLERDFQRDLEHCTEFDAAEYKRRNVAARFRDSVTRLISPLL
jgi:cardiolipin synthase